VIKAVRVADGFLGRWSQRKQALREGRAVDEPPAPPVANPVRSGAGTAIQVKPNDPADDKASMPDSAASPSQPPTPTLDDVKALRADSSFAPFVARGVSPEVRNAAMKKLFTDPHFNVMDGLDIYIDDYSLPSPMPAAMLRQMASAKFLNLFDEDPVKPLSPLNDKTHDHTDLRLQPDHAAGLQGAEREPERAPDTAHQPVPPGSR
jgi:hypothetical protein